MNINEAVAPEIAIVIEKIIRKKPMYFICRLPDKARIKSKKLVVFNIRWTINVLIAIRTRYTVLFDFFEKFWV
ncbi:MAG: hypothetical protein AB9907_11270 [Flexilinea sp.]